MGYRIPGLRMLFPVLLLIFCLKVGAQDEQMRVERIRVVPENVPILNINVDDENVKWVANTKTLYKIDAKDHAVEVPIGAGEMSLLQLPGGNHDVRWNTDALAKILGNAQVTTAAYDKGQKILWIGTNGYGVFKLRVEPRLTLMEQMHIDNSKLRSDFINSIFIAKSGKVWIATEDGAVSIQNNSWTIHQKFFNILRIRGRGNELWAIGDDLIWIIDGKDNWSPIDLNRRQIEGEIHDIAVDPEGRVWIASNIMTSYRISSDRYQHFGPGQYFTSQFVNFVSVDDDATIWVGTKDKGLYIIEKESNITVTMTMEKYLDCNGTAPNAEISVRAIGGKPPYEFTWENGITGDRRNGLGPGNYKLTVTDSDGSKKATSVEVADPFIQLTAKTDRIESGEGTEDGAVSVEVKGGVPPYSYEWYSGMGEASLTGLQQGEYGVTVTDAAGCSAMTTASVPRKLMPLAVTLEQKQFIQCASQQNAIVAAFPVGGKNPYTYAWSSGSTLEFAENLSAGKYTLTVTDAQGNTATATITIAQPEALTASIRIDAPAKTNTNDGKATVQVKGGKAPYQYLWDNGETEASAIQLAPRNHMVTVTDALNCKAEATINIQENILPLAVAISQSDVIVCAGNATGGLKGEVQGGKSPFKYSWSNGTNTENAGKLAAGKYSLTVTDAAGNTASASASIAEPEILAATLRIDAPASTNNSNGKASVRVTGGKAPYTYLWDNGETTATASALSPQRHVVTVTDASLCTAEAAVDIQENILPLNASITQTSVLRCTGDATAGIQIEVNGGKSPYAYSWSSPGYTGAELRDLGAGSYEVTVSDAAGTTSKLSLVIKEPTPIKAQTIAESPAATGTNEGHAIVRADGGTGRLDYLWDNGDTGSKTVSLSPGIHTVTVSDASGCSTVAEVNIIENILEINLTLAQTSEIQCAGTTTGAIKATIQGGKEPYVLTWEPNLPSEQTQQNLAAGTYKLSVTDAAGNQIQREIVLKAPKALTVNTEVLAAASANNADGRAIAKSEGGVSPYTTRWSSGASGAEISGLAPGSYQVTVTDANGCSNTSEIKVVEDVLEMRAEIVQTGQVLCAGQKTGALEVKTTGGKSPFTYKWEDQSTGNTRKGLTAGDYSVDVTDAANQHVQVSYTISEPATISAEVSDLRAATHERIKDGKATVKATGGSTPYVFAWDNGESTARAGQLSVGPHQVTVTDANGCSVAMTAEISQKILPELTAENLEKGEAVRMEKLQFDADSTNINESSIPTLEELYEFLYDNPTIVVEIGGHTNGLPADDYCDQLSDARAKAVAEYIIKKGIDAKRIIAKGYGKRQPIATNMTPEGRRKNQRVEVKIVKLSE